MTTLTGSTEQTLSGTLNPPSFALALTGAACQLGAVGWVWATQTSAKTCMLAPLDCLANFSDADPFGISVMVVLACAAAVWAVSVTPVLLGRGTHSDPSIIDRLWSLTPWLWCWHLYIRSSASNSRLLLMTALATMWGVRLTWNFAIKGGYSGGEDYRWAEVRKWFPGWRYEVFNVIFICTFQQVELLAISVPAVAAFHSTAPLGIMDAVATVTFLILLLGETVADLQMFAFQTEKYRRKNAGLPLGPYERGFIETGLWALSRHPNYFCEVALWWSFYLFSIPATGTWINWTVLGALFLTVLFVPPGASIDVTEALSSRKYPGYPEYQKRVSRFVPWLPRIQKCSGKAE